MLGIGLQSRGRFWLRWICVLLVGLELCGGGQVLPSDGATAPYLVGRTVTTASSWQAGYDAVGVTVADINADGSLAWSKTVNSGDLDVVGGNAADSKGNLYVVGSTRGNLTATPNAGSFDLFVIKLNASGHQVWQKQIGTPQHDEARNVLVIKEGDGNEYLYVLGVTYGALDENLHVNNGYRQFGGRDLFMFKFDLNGTKLWSRQFGTSIDDYLYGVTFDAGQLLVAGGAGIQSTKSRYLVGFNTTGIMLDVVSDGGVTILPIQMHLAEATSTIGTYNIVLNRKPIAPVTITMQHVALAAPNGQLQTQVTFSPTNLVFNSSNWNIPQYVSVVAIDDSICEHTHYAKISHSVLSADPHFANETPFILGSNLTFTISDNDYASIKLSRQHLFAVEGGFKDSYSVVLTSEPWQDVIVTALALWPTQTQLTPSQLTFTRANWNTSQMIVVQAMDDSLSENEFNGVHSGGNIVHYSSSLDCNYNTRQPSCYYLATCNCSGVVSLGNCSLNQSSCQAGSPTLACDTNITDAMLVGNGVPIVRLSGGNLSNPVSSIPVRYGAPALNPNPPTTTTIVINSDMEKIAISTRQVQYNPPPYDNGWGGVWTNQTVNKIDPFANPNPLSYSVLGLNVSAIPADVAGYVYSFMAVDNARDLATLALSQKDLIWSMCIGTQRLTTQRWAFEEWPPGMSDRVLDALDYLFPTVRQRQLWNCGGSLFTPDSQLDVNIFDNDPGITISNQRLRVTEGGDSASYSVVLNAPPYQLSGGTQSLQSFCGLNSTLDQCLVNFTPSSYFGAFNIVRNVNDSVTIVARSNRKISITPPYLVFTNENWFLPQLFSVAAIDDFQDTGSLNTTIEHDIFSSSVATMGYVNASFWTASTLPLSNNSYLIPPLPYNALPTIYNGPNHRVVQVSVQENDQAAIIVSTASLSIKEIQVKSDYNTVGDVNHGLCTDSLTVSAMSGTMSSVLIFAANQSSYLRFHMPYLHHNTFQSTLGAAFIELTQTKYTVVNMTWLNMSASLNPSFLVEVSLIQSNWTEASFNSPIPLPVASLVQNVTMIDSIVRIDVTKLIRAVLASLPVVSFRVTVLAASDSVQLYARSDPENILPVLIMRKQYPNLLFNQTTFQDTGSAISSAAAVDGDISTATSTPFNWWQVNLTNVQPLGTLAVFIPTNFTVGSITIAVSTQPFDTSFNLTSPPPHTILRTFPVRRPVFVWPILSAGQFIRVYTSQIPLAEVQLYARGINITTTDDGYNIRLTDLNVEAKVNPDYEQRGAWQLASGSYSLQDNLALGMIMTQSSVNAIDPPALISTMYETNPWWQVDLGSTQSISTVTLSIARTIAEAAACAYPEIPTKPNTISSFTLARIRLSDNPMNATLNVSGELVQTQALTSCFNLTLSWKLFASGRYLRVDFIGNGSLNIAAFNVERWSTKFSQYALLELRGSGFALPSFSFLDPKKAPISYRVFSSSTTQAFDLNQPWGSKCYLGSDQREWLIIDFISVQQLDSIQLILSPTKCSNNQSSVNSITTLSLSVYGDPLLVNSIPSTPSDTCSCQSDSVGRISTSLPASCQNICSSIQCTSNICNNGLITQGGVTLSLAGFHDIVVMADVLSLPCLTLPLSRDAYSLVVLRDEPLAFIQLTQPFKEVNLTTINVTFVTTSVFPLGYAVLQPSNSSLVVENIFQRIPWFGISYINTRDSSFTLEFWAAILSQTSGPIVNYVSSGSAMLEIGISANLSSYFTLTYQGIATTLIGPQLPLSASSNNASWVHLVASYDWKAQSQYFYVNTWTIGTSQTQVAARQGSRNDTIALALDGKLVFAPMIPCWFAKIAWYQRSLSNYEVLEHFYRPTPIQTNGMFTVKLATIPVNPVDISFITESNCYRWGLCNTSVQPSSLRFTAENWNRSHNVYVHGTDDFMAEGMHSDTISNEIKSTPSEAISTQVTTPMYSNAASFNLTSFFSTWVLNQTTLVSSSLTDAIGMNFGSIQAAWSQQTLSTSKVILPAYSNLSATPVQVQLTDINVAAVEISSYYLSITENGLRDIFQVVLTAEPKANVTIQFNASTDCYRKCGPATADNPCPITATNFGNETLLCNCTVVPSSIVFTPQNWELPQPITVIPTDDRLQEATLHYTKIVPTTSSLDPAYNKMFLESIRVAIADNDVSSIIISTNSISLSENDTTTNANYSVVLTTEPWSEVNITISNEAAGGCYRTCGYPIDSDSCGLPRPLATNSIEIMTSSVREIQSVTASMTTTNGVQLITTTTTHIDPIFTVQITGGYALPQYRLTITFPTGAVLTTSYGSSFRISTATNVSPNLDGFISAMDLQSALNALQAGFTVTRTTKSIAPALILEWRIVYTLTTPTMPALVLNSPASFAGTGVLTSVVSVPIAPSGMLGFNYGPIKGPNTLVYGASASQLASYLESIPGINTVTVQRILMTYGYEYSITFTSVPVYYSTLTVDTSLLQVDTNALSSVSVNSINTRQPNSIGGWFALQYRVNSSYVATSQPLQYNATSDEVVTALQGIPTLGAVHVQQRQLTPELTYTWTIEFSGNVGPVSNLTAISLNLTGLGSNVAVAFIQQGDQLGGFFTIQLGGLFQNLYPSGEVYKKMVLPRTTSPLPFNANSTTVQKALLNLQLDISLAGVQVNRLDSLCDVFGRCRQYSWQITFAGTPGNIPQLTVQSNITGNGATLTPTTIANGTYLTGNFTISLQLNDSGTILRGTTWQLPINVTSDGVKEALEAIPFITSDRAADSSFDPANPTAIPKATKGVRVSRTGPYLDGGYKWLLDWSLNDWERFTNINITTNITFVGQDIAPIEVATQYSANGPRCASYISTVFLPDATDPFGLRGSCVYPIVLNINPERYLCNMTVVTPRKIFNASNWYLPQKIFVKSVHDFLDETNKTDLTAPNVTWSTLVHEAYTLDFIYAALPIPNVAVSVFDIDQAQVIVSRSLLYASENGSIVDSYTLKLTTEPLSDVLVTIYPYIQWKDCYRFGLCNVTLDTTEVLFTVKNWYIPQSVYMHATPDHLDEADVHFGGISHAVYSDDVKYNGIAVPNITVKIYDMDTSTILVSKTSVNIGEDGASDSYTLVLSTEPWAKVTITPISNGTDSLGNQITLSSPLVFTWLNWNISQSIIVNAVHDWRVDPLPHTTLIRHSITTNDLIYINCRISNVTATTKEIDVAGVELSSSSIAGYEGMTTPITYSVRLKSMPWFPVTLIFNGSHNGCNFNVCNITVATKMLVFTPANWSTWQNVSVFVTDDKFDEGGVHTANISTAISTVDQWYSVVQAPLMTVIIGDNDVSGIQLSSTQNMTVAQGSFNSSFSLVLTSEPWSDVTILLQIPRESFLPRGGTQFVQEPLLYTSSPSGQVISTIVFPRSSWNISQSVVVSALTTGSPKPLTLYSNMTIKATAPDLRYNASASSTLYFTVLGKEDVPPPVPLTALFDATGVKIFITFDSTVFHNATMTVDQTQPFSQVITRYILPSQPFSCSLVWNLTATPTYSLGSGANCLWLNLTTMQMVLGSGATVAPSDTLVLNGCGSQYANNICYSPLVLKSRDYNALFTTASIGITLGSVVVPQIMLVGPKSIGPCGTLVLDATGSSGSANRAFQVRWFGILASAVNSTSNASLAYQLTQNIYAQIAPYCNNNITIMNPFSSASELQSMCQLRSLANNAAGMSWSVNRSVLLSSKSYIFGVQLSNFFQQTSTATQVVATLSDPIPVVSIVGPSTLSIQRSQSLKIQATTSSTSLSCTSITSPISFAWSVLSTTNDGSNVTIVKSNTAVDPRYFILPANILSVMTNYTIRINAFYASDPTLSSSDQVSVSVILSPLVARFAGGSYVLGGYDTLTLNASSSYDPDKVATTLSFAWSCLDVTPIVNTTTGVTTGIANLPCINPATGNAIDMAVFSTAIVSLSPGTFPVSKVLRFSVVVSHLCTASTCISRNATASLDVTTIPGRIPIVRAQASASLINPSTKVILSSNVSSLYPYTTIWSQDQGDLNMTQNPFIFPLSSTQNAIAPNVLTPGKTYIFRLTALDSNGNNGYGTVTIAVNAPPTPGSISITPTQGTAITDLFTITCAGWTDENLPLSYSFYLSTDTGLVPLASDLTLPSAQVRLYLSNSSVSNATVNVVGQVADSLRGVSTISTTAMVLQPTTSNASSFWSTISNGTLSSAIQGGNYGDALNVLLSTAAVVQSQQTSASIECNTTTCIHGTCSSSGTSCICASGYSGSNCDISDAHLNDMAQQMLESLHLVSSAMQPSASTLTQSAMALNNIIAFNVEAPMASENINRAATVLSSITSSAITLPDSATFVSSSGSSVLSATSSLLQNTNSSGATSSRRRLTTDTGYQTILQSLYTMIAISGSGLLQGESPVSVVSPQMTTFSVLGNTMPFKINSQSAIVNLTSAVESCIADSYFLDVISWTKPVHTNALPLDTPALLPSIQIGVHTLTALANAQFNGQSLVMKTITQSDPCVQFQKNQLNTDDALNLVTLAMNHAPLNKGSRFATNCLSWNASSAQWDNSVCSKVVNASSTTSTVCACTQLTNLEVVVVSQEVLSFVPANATVYRNDPPSIVPGITLAFILCVYGLGLRWSTKKDASDKEALRLMRLGSLNKNTWDELLQAEKAKTVEDIARRQTRKKKPFEMSSYEVNTATAFLSTWQPKEETSAEAQAQMIDSELNAIDTEAKSFEKFHTLTDFALFGTLRLQSQHTIVRRSLQVLNVFMVLVAAVFFSVGIDFFWFLGNTSNNMAIAVFGSAVGIGFLVFGISLAIVACVGLLAAYQNTSRRLRAIYIALLLILVIGECILLGIAYKHLIDLKSFPSSTKAYLQTQWAQMSTDLRESIQDNLGCCGFTSLSDTPVLPCPDAAMDDPLAPRTCFTILTQTSSNLFQSMFNSLIIVVIAQVVGLALANILVRWEALRIQNLANGTKNTLPLFDTFLRCLLPVGSHLSACAMVFTLVAGLDILLQWDLFALASITVFLRLELGIPLIIFGGLYIGLHMHSATAIAAGRSRSMKWYLAGHLMLLLAGAILVIMLSTVSSNLGTYSNFQSMLQSRYLGLSTQQKLLLETDFICCGFNATSQGTCSQPTTLPVCDSIITSAIADFMTTTESRLVAFLISQLVLIFLSGLLKTQQGTTNTQQALMVPDQFTDPVNATINRICAQLVLLASLLVAFCGALFIGVGCDLILETNIVTISAVLRTFSYYIGAYILIFGILLVDASILGLYAALTRKKIWLWRYAVVLLTAWCCCVALFAASYRIQNPITSSAVNATMFQTWKGFSPASQKFVQDAYSCCGFEKLVIGDQVTFSLPYMETQWSINSTSGSKTLNSTISCPSGADSGCSSFMLTTLLDVASFGQTAALFIAALVFLMFVASGVLYYRQGKKKLVTWRVLCLQTLFLLVAIGLVITLIGLALLGIDVAFSTTVFTSNIIQVLFGGRIGGALIALVIFATMSTSYGIYGAIHKSLDISMIYLVVGIIWVIVGWSCAGVTANLTANLNWQVRLDTYLDGIWSSLSDGDWYYIGSSRQCCGYHDPTQLSSSKYQFDRAVSQSTGVLECPPLTTVGCRKYLLSDATLLLTQLNKLLIAFASLQTVLWVLAAALLRGLILLEHSLWVSLKKKLRWWLARYKESIKKQHIALSLAYTYDAKFTRAQRLTCVLCAAVAVCCVDAAAMAGQGCTRLGPVTCQPQTGYEVGFLGFVYSLVSIIVQIIFVAIFNHIRHRQDDDDSAKVAERRRKEKVYLRDVFHQSLHSLTSKLGHFAMATSEERFYSWLALQVKFVVWGLSWARILWAIAIGVYLGLSQIGLGFYVFTIQVPGTFAFISVPAALLASSFLVFLCGLLKNKKRFTRYAHFGYIMATIVSILLVCLLAVIIFMMIQAMDEPTSPPNWTQRNTNFSVVDSIKAIWLNDTAGFQRKQWQTQLQCCGLPEFPLRPCPVGTTELQNVTAQRVDGTIVLKTITIVHDLGGCLDPILAQIQSVVQTVLVIFVVMAAFELLYACCTYFLARDIVISLDSQLRRAAKLPSSPVAGGEPLEPETSKPIVPPQRGRMLSTLVQTSINNVSKSVAQLLSKSSLSTANRPKPLPPSTLSALHIKLRLRYPAWIVWVAFGGAWICCAGCIIGAIILALDLANDSAWLWLASAITSLALHLAIVEPIYLLGLVVSQSLSGWWQSTWIATLIGMGRAVLHLDTPQADTSAAILLDPFTRIRHNAAITIQRRWICKLCRMRYLIILRVARENQHRQKVEGRIRKIRLAVSSFTREETEAFTMLFRDADYAKTGLVSHKVVSKAVHALGVQVPTAVVKEYLLELDDGFTDLIDLDYFLYVMSCIRGYHQAQQDSNATSDALVIPHTHEAKVQAKRQNMLRELKEKRASVSKQLMTKVGKLASQLHKTNENSNEKEDAKPSGAYILLNTKKPLRPNSAAPREIAISPKAKPSDAVIPSPTMDTVDSVVQERSAELTSTKPEPKAQLSIRATKDIEKAMKLLKHKQDGDKKRKMKH